jgi:hypothetical protein
MRPVIGNETVVETKPLLGASTAGGFFMRNQNEGPHSTPQKTEEPLSRSLVLLDRPEYLNIPYFSMPDPSSRENQFARLSLTALPKMVGRPCSAWVNEHRDNIQLIRTRNYLPLRQPFMPIG